MRVFLRVSEPVWMKSVCPQSAQGAGWGGQPAVLGAEGGESDWVGRWDQEGSVVRGRI